MAGLFFGSFAAGIIALAVFKYPLLTGYFTNTTFNLALLAAILSGGTVGIYMEFKKNTNKVIRFFQGSVIKKTALLLTAYFFIRFVLILDSAVHKHIYGKYELFATEIAKTVSDGISSGNLTPEIDNRLKIDYVLVTEAYSLTEENLLKTGKISEKLAKSMAQRNASTEGTYLHIAKNDKVMAVAVLKPGIDVENRFHLTQTGSKIRFYVRRETKKDKFGKRFEEFVIYAVE
jgi:hypothetical protein